MQVPLAVSQDFLYTLLYIVRICPAEDWSNQYEDTNGSLPEKEVEGWIEVSAHMNRLEGWHHTHITLSPLNANYRSIEISAEGVEDGEFKIYGEFVQVINAQ